MQTRHCIRWLSISLTTVALSGAALGGESYAQGVTADTASTTPDEGGGTCDGCLAAATADRDEPDDGSANRDFITGISRHDRDADDPVPTPSAAVFSFAMLAIGAVAIFVRRWFSAPV